MIAQYRNVGRKIRNHEEVVQTVKNLYPHFNIQSVDFAFLSFYEQLKVIRTTDILIGAHGAGVAHITFLPTTSAVIEFWIDDR